jgi:uncharacterized protein
MSSRSSHAATYAAAEHAPPGVPLRRGRVQAFLETRGLVGGHAAAHVHVRLRADDGTALAATFLPGPRTDAPAIVLVHGFAAHRRKPAYARLADRLTAVAHVLAVDLRGHGRSAGLTTLGDREALDVEAGVQWLRERGHRKVVLVGASMGATAALHALARGTEADAAVVVSAPAVLEDEPASVPMQRLKRLWESPVSRAGMRWAIGVRVVHPARWQRPDHPRDLATAVAVPLLVVHGEDDAYFPVSDALLLTAAATTSCLWLEPSGFGHAEDGFTDAFADRLGAAVLEALSSGRFPVAPDVEVFP